MGNEETELVFVSVTIFHMRSTQKQAADLFQQVRMGLKRANMKDNEFMNSSFIPMKTSLDE